MIFQRIREAITISITYGYIRVSTREQNEDRQLIALREMAVPEENLFMDKQSGKDFNRPQYSERCAPGKSASCWGLHRGWGPERTHVRLVRN